ncbi:hypothetical protein [Microbacterium terregens]|uniref:Uncharacterized protein n=1 Tax=Microbacterium terregens TaxID=69363 RepID=A0ABV5T3M8_9MICO
MTDAPAPDVPDTRRRDIPLAVISVGMATVVWWPAFTLGAWGDLFFDQVLTLWAASTAAFVFVLFERRPMGRRLLRALLLLLPSTWLVFSFVDLDTTDLFAFVATAFALLVVLIASPLTVWVLARIMWPDFSENSTARQRWLIVGVVLGIGIASFVLGLNQAHFLTCEEFAISGNSEPPGCVHESE